MATFDARTRLLRGGLLVAAAAVTGSIAWTLRRPPAPAPAPPAPLPAGLASGAPPTRMDDLVYRNLKGGHESFVLRAHQMAGREQEQVDLQVVNLRFGYVRDGQPGHGTIDADECLYFPAKQEARFQGHVKLVTEDGMQLESERLVYAGEAGNASSDRPVQFRRNELSGRAQRMDYEANAGRLNLDGEVFLRLEDRGQGAAEIESASATLLRQQGELQFQDDVRLRRGGDTLTAEQLTLYGQEDEIERMAAVGKVHLRATSDTLPGLGAPGPATASKRPGPRDLHCHRLDVKWRSDHSLENAAARENAVLVVLPAPGEASERRTLKGSTLAFRWDEQGRITELQGQKDVEFVGEPLPPDTASPRRLKSRNLVAALDPESGAVTSAEFNKDVEFERGMQKARGGHAEYSAREGVLQLQEEPSLIDTEQASRLEAETIELLTQSSDARARYAVRHTIEKRAGNAGTFPGAADDTTVITSRLFDYDSKTKTARYREGALLRSGKNELRAAEIRRIDAVEGQRRLEAQGDVVTLLRTKPNPGEPEQAPLDGRSQELYYDEAKHEILYKGDAVLVQSEVRTKSPQAKLTLSEDGSELQRLEAWDPVELRQGTRISHGQKGVYTPGDKTIVVTGDKVDIKDEAQQQTAQGRKLTFYVGDDRILVDGREETRTETTMRRKPIQ
jgi:LPS export ABC transporter protein LptC